MKMVYFALVESRLRYGILGWGGVVSRHRKKLDIMQKKFLKIMLSKFNTYSSDDFFSDDKIMDIRQIYFLCVVSNQHKNKHMLSLSQHKYETRNKDKAMVSVANKTIGQRNHIYLSSRLYNKLATELKQIKSIKLFKKSIKKYILSINRYVIHDLIDIKN